MNFKDFESGNNTFDYNNILKFWFSEITPSRWWKKDAEFDSLIKLRYEAIHAAAAKGELFTWRKDPKGRLAEIIILDQFSRNMYRDTPQAFAYDHIALILAQEAIYNKADENLSANEQLFMLMPFMHSESKYIHEIAEKLFNRPGLESNMEYELKHKKIIDRFGRYPHRNKILGRISSQEEIDFLKEPDSSF